MTPAEDTMIDITVSTDEDTAFTECLDQLLDDHATSVGFPFDNTPINLTAEIDGTFAGGMWVDTCGYQVEGLDPRLGSNGYRRLDGRVHEEDRIHPTKHLSGGDDAPR